MGSPFKMNPKTPLMKALVGKQKNLPEQLKQAILDAPAQMTDKGKKKPQPFKDPGEPADFKKGTWKGSTEVVGMPYEGAAFTGRSGSGKSFKAGKKVPAWSHTEDFAGTKKERNVRLSGETKVTENQPKYLDQPGSQRRNVKGSTIEVKKYKSKSKSSPAKMTGKKTDAQLKAQRGFTTGAGKGKRKVKTKTPTSIYVKKEKTASAITPKGVKKAATKMIGNYKMTSIKQKVKRNAKK